jgi:putative ABC transport system ATP-binding protein
MDIFQSLKEERGITIVLITHEPDVAAYGSRIVAFRDGVIVSNEANTQRRTARAELVDLPVAVEEVG